MEREQLTNQLKIEALTNGIIPREKGLNKVVPPPPEYILMICIIEFLDSNCKRISYASWSIPDKGIVFPNRKKKKNT
jgi:hypothetical protein